MAQILPKEVTDDLQQAENDVELPQEVDTEKLINDEDAMQQKMLRQLQKDIEETKQKQDEFREKALQLQQEMQELNKQLLQAQAEGK